MHAKSCIKGTVAVVRLSQRRKPNARRLFRLWNGWFSYVQNEKNVVYGNIWQLYNPKSRVNRLRVIQIRKVWFNAIWFWTEGFVCVNQNYVGRVRANRKWLCAIFQLLGAASIQVRLICTVASLQNPWEQCGTMWPVLWKWNLILWMSQINVSNINKRLGKQRAVEFSPTWTILGRYFHFRTSEFKCVTWVWRECVFKYTRFCGSFLGKIFTSIVFRG